MAGRLIILSGPSCVGKSPLDKALGRFYPEIKKSLQSLLLYNSREARPGETDGVDYFFRTREEIDMLKQKQRFVIMEVRGDLQALDLGNLEEMLQKGDVFFEGNPFIGSLLLTHKDLEKFNKLSIFMSPLSCEEILSIKNGESNLSLAELLTDVMRRKLLRRTKKQKTELSLRDYENIEKRAASAYEELKKAYLFEHVIPNHDGEDSENWNAFYYPIGDARKSLLAFVALKTGKKPDISEKWESSLIE